MCPGFQLNGYSWSMLESLLLYLGFWAGRRTEPAIDLLIYDTPKALAFQWSTTVRLFDSPRSNRTATQSRTRTLHLVVEFIVDRCFCLMFCLMFLLEFITSTQIDVIFFELDLLSNTVISYIPYQPHFVAFHVISHLHNLLGLNPSHDLILPRPISTALVFTYH